MQNLGCDKLWRRSRKSPEVEIYEARAVPRFGRLELSGSCSAVFEARLPAKKWDSTFLCLAGLALISAILKFLQGKRGVEKHARCRLGMISAGTEPNLLVT